MSERSENRRFPDPGETVEIKIATHDGYLWIPVRVVDARHGQFDVEWAGRLPVRDDDGFAIWRNIDV